MTLLGLILPWWARWAAIGAMTLAACLTTWQMTSAYYADQMDLQRLEVERAGDRQNARTALQVEQQQRITEGVVHGWDNAIKSARAPYQAPPAVDDGRRRPAVAAGMREQPAAGSGLLPAVSGPAGRTDGPAADGRLADCAETTLMLTTLQEWVRRQQEVMP